MTPATANLRIKTNGYYTAVWQIKSNDVAVDLTGYTFELTVREAKNISARVIYELNTEDSTDGSITISDTPEGKITVEIKPKSSIKETKICFYDLLAKFAGKEYVWVEGRITLDPGTSYTADD